jgi:hypothetical protein
MQTTSKSSRGEAVAIIVVAVAVIGAAALWIFKPRGLDGDSRRADAAAQANADVNAAAQAQAATAAASVAKIGQATADLPGDSPAEDFIGREATVALSLLPSPDPKALLEAERRRVAIMEGRVEEARKLYAQSLKESERLLQERNEALSKQRASEERLAQVAAERLGAARQRNAVLALAGVLIVLLIAAKFYMVSPSRLGKMVADLRAGEPIETVFDRYVDLNLQSAVQKAFRLNVKIPDGALRQTANTNPPSSVS